MDFLSVAVTILGHPIVKAVLALIVANIFAGLISDIRNGVLRWDQQADFLKTMVIPYVGGGMLVQLVLWAVAADWLPQMWAEVTGTGVWLVIILMLLARFGRLLKGIAPNLPIPLDPAISTDTTTTQRLPEVKLAGEPGE